MEDWFVEFIPWISFNSCLDNAKCCSVLIKHAVFIWRQRRACSLVSSLEAFINSIGKLICFNLRRHVPFSHAITLHNPQTSHEITKYLTSPKPVLWYIGNFKTSATRTSRSKDIGKQWSEGEVHDIIVALDMSWNSFIFRANGFYMRLVVWSELWESAAGC